MKQVTIENVKARIAKLQSRGNAEYSLGLTLNEEFELACLRQLLAQMKSVQVLPSGWKSVQVVPDAATAIRACLDEFPDSVHDIVEECAAIAENACRAAMLNQAQEPTTDNAAQQFEALATSAGSGKP